MVKALNLDKAYAFYKERFCDAADFTFVITGNFALRELKPFILTYLGGLPVTGRKEKGIDYIIAPPPGIVKQTVKMGIGEKGRVELIFHGAFDYTCEHVMLFDLLPGITASKLRDVLRNEQGSVYQVEVTGNTVPYPRAEYFLFISFYCAPEKTDMLTTAVFDVLNGLKQELPGRGLLPQTKEFLKYEQQAQKSENEFWLRILKTYCLNHWDFNLIEKYGAFVDNITEETVKNAIKKYFNKDQYVQVVSIKD